MAQSGKETAEVNVMHEINTMTARILLICAFGVDINDKEVDFWVNGKLEKRTVGVSLCETFNDLVKRIGSPHV